MNTPWNTAEDVNVICPGITLVSTPSHGGFLLSEEKRAVIKKRFPTFKTFVERGNFFPKGHLWFEEDCDAVLVEYCFPEAFPKTPASVREIYIKRIQQNTKYYGVEVAA